MLVPIESTGAETIITAVMESNTGFDSNPRRKPAGDVQLFATLTPSLFADTFISESVDMTTLFTYSSRRYFGTDGYNTPGISGSVTLHGISHGTEGYLSMTFRKFDNEGFPEDNSRMFEIMATAVHHDLGGRSYSISVYSDLTRYPNILSETGETFIQNRVTTRPGIGIPVKNDLYLWGDLILQWVMNNSNREEYFGYTALLGLEYSPSSPFRIGASLQFGSRDYWLEYPDEEIDHYTYIGSCSLWCNHRLSNSWDSFFQLQGGTYRSETDISTFTRWNIQTGLRIYYEIFLGS